LTATVGIEPVMYSAIFCIMKSEGDPYL